MPPTALLQTWHAGTGPLQQEHVLDLARATQLPRTFILTPGSWPRSPGDRIGWPEQNYDWRARRRSNMRYAGIHTDIQCGPANYRGKFCEGHATDEVDGLRTGTVLDGRDICVVRYLGSSAQYGFVNLPRVRRHDGEYDCCSESSRRILGEFGEFAPCNEPGCEFFAIE